ncbi:hypothetical protein CC2G_001313 [Coprinopsis cinerea AmutBmut pab1-1]|nr:hypothetical protein CC2G_001313 [Coprinopsis cinerea AmutBmut pab1-1]
MKSPKPGPHVLAAPLHLGPLFLTIQPQNFLYMLLWTMMTSISTSPSQLSLINDAPPISDTYKTLPTLGSLGRLLVSIFCKYGLAREWIRVLEAMEDETVLGVDVAGVAG